jgi:hypothetical protein
VGAGGWCIVTWHMLLDPTPPCVLQAAGRTPLFDQLIANRYSPGEGLSPHVDLLRFQVGARGEEGGGDACVPGLEWRVGLGLGVPLHMAAIHTHATW